jgi:hypothetical protein
LGSGKENVRVGDRTAAERAMAMITKGTAESPCDDDDPDVLLSPDPASTSGAALHDQKRDSAVVHSASSDGGLTSRLLVTPSNHSGLAGGVRAPLGKIRSNDLPPHGTTSGEAQPVWMNAASDGKEMKFGSAKGKSGGGLRRRRGEEERDEGRSLETKRNKAMPPPAGASPPRRSVLSMDQDSSFFALPKAPQAPATTGSNRRRVDISLVGRASQPASPHMSPTALPARRPDRSPSSGGDAGPARTGRGATAGFGGLVPHTGSSLSLRSRSSVRKRPSRLVSAEREAEQRVNRLLSAMPAPSRKKAARTSTGTGGVSSAGGFAARNKETATSSSGGLSLSFSGNSVAGAEISGGAASKVGEVAAAPAATGGFSFGGAARDKAAPDLKVAATAAAAPAGTGGFSFGGAAKDKAALESKLAVTPTAAPAATGGFSFACAAKDKTAAPAVSTASGGFSFASSTEGNGNIPPSAPLDRNKTDPPSAVAFQAAAPAPPAGATEATSAVPTKSSAGFSFGGRSGATKESVPAPTHGFAFGGDGASVALASAPTAKPFGGAAPSVFGASTAASDRSTGFGAVPSSGAAAIPNVFSLGNAPPKPAGMPFGGEGGATGRVENVLGRATAAPAPLFGGKGSGARGAFGGGDSGRGSGLGAGAGQSAPQQSGFALGGKAKSNNKPKTSSSKGRGKGKPKGGKIQGGKR